MRKYVTPVITCVELRANENIASTTKCFIGSCDRNNDGIYEWVGATGS